MRRPTYLQLLIENAATHGLNNLTRQVLGEYSINASQWIILGLARDRRDLRVSDVAAFLRVKDPLATNLINDLVKMKLVKHHADASDGRAKVLTLTDEGAQLIKEIEPRFTKSLASIKACASPADWATYFATLEKIIAATE